MTFTTADRIVWSSRKRKNTASLSLSAFPHIATSTAPPTVTDSTATPLASPGNYPAASDQETHHPPPDLRGRDGSSKAMKGQGANVPLGGLKSAVFLFSRQHACQTSQQNDHSASYCSSHCRRHCGSDSGCPLLRAVGAAHFSHHKKVRTIVSVICLDLQSWGTKEVTLSQKFQSFLRREAQFWPMFTQNLEA